MVMHAFVLAGLVGSPWATLEPWPEPHGTTAATTAPAATAPAVEPAGTEPPATSRRPPRGPKPPWSWRFVGAHYGTGVLASLLVLPGSYGLAGWVGHRGKGLGPVVGAMLLGAVLPPVLTYTAQWGVGRAIAPRRERYWPGFLVHQVGHLAVFAGAILGGADFRVFGQVAPVVLTDAVVVTGLGSLTAEATRRPLPPLPEPAGAGAPWAQSPGQVIVPVLEVRLP